MHVPSPGELLDIWDAGSDRDHTDRALLLLAAARPGTGEEDLADVTIGARDLVLLELRERLFGPRVEALVRCPGCGAQLELTFDCADALADPAAGCPGDPLALIAGDHDIIVRLPTSRDLLDARGPGDAAEVRALILGSCLLSARESGAEVEPGALPEPVQQAISKALGEADPQAEVELALQCAACGHSWRTHFDVVDYLWAEIDHLGRRMARDVHLLARAYGWSEAAVLALPAWRRDLYRAMILDG
jgi:hypothetical protein